MANNKILNIAMLGHKHVLSREGGIEIVVRHLATGMAERGHRVVCYDRDGDDSSRTENGNAGAVEGITIIPVWTLKKRGFAALTSSLVAAWKAAKSDADIVHIHAEGPAAMCGLVKMLGKKKVIVTIHGLDWQRAKWGGMASRYIKFGEKQAVKYADNIIVLSRGLQDYFLNLYGRETYYIPNGVSLPQSVEANEITNKWGLKKNSYILFIGRIVPEKGLTYLIEAWKNIKTDKKLMIVGGSSDTNAFLSKLQDSTANDESIILAGFQQGKILEELYSNCYLYVLPSDLEGMPLALLEAMSYGNCCVVSDINECSEVVEDKAVVFPRANVEELCRTLQNLIDNQSIVEKYRSEAASYITSRFNWDDVIEKTLDVYNS